MSATFHTPPPPALGSALPLLALVAGCVTYSERTDSAYRDFERGQFDLAESAFQDEDMTDSVFLAGAEAGTVALTAGDWEVARDHFERAAEEVREFEDRSIASPESLGESLLSVALNDTFMTYKGEGFERVILHGCLGLTYLARGQVDGVYVEARRANMVLEAEEQLYDKKYAAGGFGHFLSAVAYELIGEADNAYIDYRRMVEKGVGLELAGPALVRISGARGWVEEHQGWVERFGPDSERAEGAASIVVIAGVGSVPYKRETAITIPLADGFWRMAVPEYIDRPQPVRTLRLSLPNESFGMRTAVIEDVRRIALENLSDRLGWIAAKSAARGLAKRQLTKALDDQHGGWGRLAGELFLALTERADLRSWTTLPDTWQACRLFVPPGQHLLYLDAVGGEGVDLGTYQLDPGETMFVIARSVGYRLYAHAIGGVFIPRDQLASSASLELQPTSTPSPLAPVAAWPD